MSNIIVTGGSSGLGYYLVRELRKAGHHVFNYDKANGDDVTEPNLSEAKKWFMAIGNEGTARLDVLINCAGINLIEWLENVRESDWNKVMDVNAKGIYMMSQYCLNLLAESKGTIVNIVSNAAHMPMTCSLAYNASKAAAHIMTLQLARELTKKHGITVFGIAPNKLEGTGMSQSIDEQVVETRGWTPEYAHEYQLKGLLTGEETPPERVAEFVAFLLQDKEHHRFLTGCVQPNGA